MTHEPKPATAATAAANRDAVHKYAIGERTSPPATPCPAAKLTLDGDASVLDTLAGVMDTFDPDFAIVTP